MRKCSPDNSIYGQTHCRASLLWSNLRQRKPVHNEQCRTPSCEASASNLQMVDVNRLSTDISTRARGTSASTVVRFTISVASSAVMRHKIIMDSAGNYYGNAGMTLTDRKTLAGSAITNNNYLEKLPDGFAAGLARMRWQNCHPQEANLLFTCPHVSY